MKENNKVLSYSKPPSGWNDGYLRLLKISTKYIPRADKNFFLITDELNMRNSFKYESKNDFVVSFQNHAASLYQKQPTTPF